MVTAKKRTPKQRAPQRHAAKRTPSTQRWKNMASTPIPDAQSDDDEAFPRTDPFDSRLSDEEPPDIE